MPGPRDCMFCGYDCTGVPSGICPECGRPAFRFTDRAREILTLANEHAKRLLARPKSVGQQLRSWFLGGAELYGIGGSHILMAILTGPQGIGYHAIRQLVTDAAPLLRELEELDGSLRSVTLPADARLPLRPGSQRIVKQAVEEAVQLGHDYVGSEHLLLAICSAGEPVLQTCLFQLGITHEFVKAFVVRNQQQRAAEDLHSQN